jgi:hypothetical protein
LKFLVERYGSQIVGGYKDIDGLSISGAMVLDVPYDDFVYNPVSPTLTDLISRKYDRTSLEVKSYFNYTNHVYHEFIDPPSLVKTTYSNLYSSGAQRRYYVRPGGVIAIGTNPAGYVFGGTETKLFCRYNAYSQNSVTNGNPWGAPKLEISISFDPLTDMRMDILDSAGSLLQTLTPGVNTASLGGYSGDFYVALTNLSASSLILSDFCLYWL